PAPECRGSCRLQAQSGRTCRVPQAFCARLRRPRGRGVLRHHTRAPQGGSGWVAGNEPAKRDVKPVAAASSAYTAVPLDLDPKPLIVAEEMNTTTRVEHFRNLVRGKKYDEIL